MLPLLLYHVIVREDPDRTSTSPTLAFEVTSILTSYSLTTLPTNSSIPSRWRQQYVYTYTIHSLVPLGLSTRRPDPCWKKESSRTS